MLMLWRVAWRNLWRQGRRSMLTVSAMAVGVALCMAMFALIDGMYTRMFDVMVSQALGHVQVHHQAWPADQQLYDTVPEVDSLLAAIDADRGVKAATVRLSCFGLAAGDKTSAGARFMGVDPDREDQVTQLKRRVVRGAYLDPAKPNGALIGAGLAEELEVEPGGEIVMISQGADGSIANALFEVEGVVETGSTVLDRAGVWTPLAVLQSTLVLPNQVHEILILSDDLDTLPALKGRVEAAGPLEGPNGQSVHLDRIQALGALSPTDLQQRLRLASIFCAPSLYEPFGLGILEAAQAGCALVLADIPTLRELWEGAALFVSPQDDAALAVVLDELLEDADRARRLGRLAAERAEQFSLEAMVEGTLAVYAEALAQRAPFGEAAA
jgi:hypothetical protein